MFLLMCCVGILLGLRACILKISILGFSHVEGSWTRSHAQRTPHTPFFQLACSRVKSSDIKDKHVDDEIRWVATAWVLELI